MQLADITIRTHLVPGDIGQVTFLHGYWYSKEYDYGLGLEMYVAVGLSEFYQNHDPAKERVWVCEHEGRMIGFLLLMNRKDSAQLRYLIIESNYRGIGLGKKLTTLFMDFLKQCGYQSAYLWTTHEQTKAIEIYKKMGFRLTEEKQSDTFGKWLTEQRYDLEF
jgi:peptidyl-dipeptidase Dcp